MVGQALNSASPVVVNRQGYIYILPAFFIIVTLLVYPLLNGIYTSLFSTNLVTKHDFAGFKNYFWVLKDNGFYNSLLITAKFTIALVIGHFLIGLVLANLLNQNIRGKIFFRAILIMPWLIPESVIAMIFKWLFNPLYGLVNHFLMSISVIDEPISWFGNGGSAFWVVVFVCIWKGYPVIMMMILTGLQSIPGELYEAARMDGAGSFRRFFSVTIPSMKEILNTALILDVVWWFKHYTIVWVLTQGGPGSSTSLISIDVYNRSFKYFQFGRAAALAVMIFIICFLIGKTLEKVLNRDEKYKK